MAEEVFKQNYDSAPEFSSVDWWDLYKAWLQFFYFQGTFLKTALLYQILAVLKCR